MSLFLASTDVSTWIPLVVVTLAMAIPIVGIVTNFFQEKQRMRLKEKAIEHGFDPEKLESEPPPGPYMPYRTGMVLLAVGAGLFLVSRYATLDVAILDFGVLAGSFVVGMVGVAFLLNDWMNRDRFDRK
jgi:hypothetical protein